MKKLITLTLLVLITSCTTNKEQPIIEYNNISYNKIPKLNSAPTVPLEPYEIHFNIEKTNKEEFLLAVNMRLYGGSHFVSPHSSDRFSGRFSISLDENNFLELDESFKEIPRSKEINDPDPFVKGLVNWVSVDTKYKHQLHLKKEIDFQVKGLVTFTIEPRCTFEKIPFIIKNENGRMWVEFLLC